MLAASNDYAARIWGVHDQKIRVSLCAAVLVYMYNVLSFSSRGKSLCILK